MAGFSTSQTVLLQDSAQRMTAINSRTFTHVEREHTLVEDNHVSTFEMMMYGVLSNWSECRMENPM